FSAVFNDTAMLRPATHHKTGYILQGDQRYFFLVAIHDETGSLIRSIRIDHAAKLHLPFLAFHHLALVGHNTYSPPFHTAQAADNALPVACLIFLTIGIIYQSADDLAHVIRFFTR